MKQWVQKLINQLDYDFAGGDKGKSKTKGSSKVSEERATLLYLLDVLNKNLIEIDTHPVRRVREQLDEFTRELVVTEKLELEKVLFRFRQFYSQYRLAEYAYIRKSFEDFKSIIWNFVEQMSDDFREEQSEDSTVQRNLEDLKEAVDTDSIDLLRTKSRQFIDIYVEQHAKKEARRSKRLKGIKKNLDDAKKQLDQADHNLNVDQLTQAHNRRSFDEQVRLQMTLFSMASAPVSLILTDIDSFKKINDSYGHPMGDFVLKECVKTLQDVFGRPGDMVARIGGDEFAILLPEHVAERAAKRADDALTQIRREIFVQDGLELKFTISMGIAQLKHGETMDQWMKRADEALYASKNLGRNRYTVAPPDGKSDGKSDVSQVA